MTDPLPCDPDACLLHHRDARGVHTLTLNQPASYNTLSEEVLNALQAALDAVAADPQGRVVVWRRRAKHFVPAITLSKCVPSQSWPITRPCLPSAPA